MQKTLKPFLKFCISPRKTTKDKFALNKGENITKMKMAVSG